MKKDILFPPVEDVAVAIARKKSSVNNYDWYVFLINNNDIALKNVLVSSKGYGYQDGKERKTSVLRHLINKLEPQSHAIIEPIDPAIFHLCNEFWVSYYIKKQIYDKKFIFVPESIVEKNLMNIPQLNLEGILHE